MGKRDDLIPEDFVLHLRKQIAGFKDLPGHHQFALARMAWQGSSKRRQHSHFEGAMTFTSEELKEAFGRNGFKRLNDSIQFFKVSPNYSMDQGYTYGYWLSDPVKRAHDKYIRAQERRLSDLLWLSGNELKRATNIPEPIAALDTKGRPVPGIKDRWQIKALAPVQVNLYALKSLRKYLQQEMDKPEEDRPTDMFMPLPQKEVLYRLHTLTSKVIKMANTTLTGLGYIAQRYASAPSGRLYGLGVSLQNAPTFVKQAALQGLWEYDFSNCHFAIVAQMAARTGYRCEAIEHYMVNKKATREKIAKDADISPEQVKEVLLATMYGARESMREENAIPEAIGKAAAERLYQVLEYQLLKADIATARTRILKHWKRTGTLLVNDCGRGIAALETATRKLAHLVQGAEAKALEIAVNMHPHHIVLLQHDGFTSTTRLGPAGMKAIEARVLELVGYQMELEEEQLQMDLNAQFLKTLPKSETGRKRSIHAGFGTSYAD